MWRTLEGAAYCWGRDEYGQLGDGGTSIDSQSPVTVEYCIQSFILDTECGLCDRCDLGSCAPQPAGSDVKNECPVGDCLTGACDGASACGVMVAGTAYGSPSDTDCDNPDTCDGQGSCVAQAPLVCDDGLYCNGAESCDPALGCRDGSDPCDDGDECTADSCDEGEDVCSHDPIPGCTGQTRAVVRLDPEYGPVPWCTRLPAWAQMEGNY